MKHQRGYSILELLLVIIVIAILAVFVTMIQPSNTTKAYQSHGFAGVFLQDLRLTKILSMGLNQRYRIVIGNGSYQIQNQNGVPITHPGTGAINVAYPSGVSITPSTTLVFDSIGRPYDASGSPLENTLIFTVASGSETAEVRVTPQTGFIQ